MNNQETIKVGDYLASGEIVKVKRELNVFYWDITVYHEDGSVYSEVEHFPTGSSNLKGAVEDLIAQIQEGSEDEVI